MSFLPFALVSLCLAATDPSLEAAEQAYQRAHYSDVIPAAEAALRHDLSDAQRIRAYVLEAMTHAAFDERRSAVLAFRRALDVQPRFELEPGVSPKVRELFEEAKRQLPLVAPAPPLTGRTVAPTPAPATPLWRRPWVMVIVAGVLVGAAGTVYAVGQRTPAGTLGRGELK